MEVKNILVPIDFSRCSKSALKIAIKLAKINEAKIHLVNAIHVHTPHPDLTGGAMLDNIISDYESQVKQSFDELEKEIIELKDVPHQSEQFLSYLSDAILSQIESKSIDLVVMGTRSEHEKIEHIIGTHATDIVQSSEVPVLVIPEDYEHFDPNKIGFASDFVKITYRGTLDILLWMAKSFEAEVSVFHVADDISMVSQGEEKQIHAIATSLHDIDHSIRTVDMKSIIDGIKEFIENHQLDMLVLLPRKHNLFEKLFRKSITKSIVVDPTIPLLTIHDA